MITFSWAILYPSIVVDIIIIIIIIIIIVIIIIFIIFLKEFATLIRLFIREVEEELLEDEEDAFLPTPDAQQKPDSPTTPLSPDGIRKLVERTLSVGQRNNSTRDSFTDGNFEPFKLNNRISRRSRGSAKRRSSKKSGLEVEAAARREVDEKERRQQGNRLPLEITNNDEILSFALNDHLAWWPRLEIWYEITHSSSKIDRSV